MDTKTPPEKSSCEVDIEQFRTQDVLDELLSSDPQPVSTNRSPKTFRYYVRTIPLNWACKAASLPGKTAGVGLALWFVAGVKRSTTIVLSGVLLRRFGIHRLAGQRGLAKLEGAGLVTVERVGRKSPRVTIIC